MESRLQIRILILTIFVLASVTCIKVPIRPVFETTGESTQLFSNPMIGLPPDTLKTRARLHVHNQQRRYMSEKGRMQRAQARRFREVGVETMDSYIKAYQEQQENYQKEQEKKFIKEAAKDKNVSQTVNNKKEYHQEPKTVVSQKVNKTVKDLPINQKPSSTGQIRNKRLDSEHPENIKRNDQNFEKDYGYNVNQEYYNPPQYKNQNEYAPTRYGQTYGRYTSIGNHDDAAVKFVPSQQLYSGDVSSLTAAALQHAPQEQQYSQINAFNSNEDYEASLAALLGKDPNDQIQGLNQLLQQSNANHKVTSEDLRNVNINLKSSSLDVPSHYYTDNQEKPTVYVPPTYVYEVDPNQAYQQVKDHTPITENVQDIADTRRPVKISPTHTTFVAAKPATLTSSSNYYKVEVASEVKEIPTSASNLYSSVPSYTSDASGYDNVSIEVKDRLNDTNSTIRRLKNRYKPKIKTEPQKIVATLLNINVSEKAPNILTSNAVNKSKVIFNNQLSFGDRLTKRNITAPRTYFTNRNKRQISFPINNEQKPSFSREYETKSRFKRYEMPVNSFEPSVDVTENHFMKIKLKTSLTNSYSGTLDDKKSNDILSNVSTKVNCSECFKSNGDSEFYYYDNDNTTDSQLDEDFPSYDDLTYANKNLSSAVSFININGTNVTSNNPHFEALRYRLGRKTKLYRLLNGVKSRVLYPDRSRFQTYLIKRPIKDYVYNIYGNGYNSGYDYGARGVNGHYSNVYDPSEDVVDYIGDSSELDPEEYYDDNDTQPDYVELDGRYNGDPYETIIERPSHSQYASGYNNYNEDYIAVDPPSYVNRNNRHNNHRYPPVYKPVREKNRYASRYNQHDNYITDNTYNDYTKNFGDRHRQTQRGHSFDYDYTQPDNSQYLNEHDSNEYIDSSESYASDNFYNHDNRGQLQEYNQNSNKDFNFYGTNHNKQKKPQEPSNYYVENFNQYVAKPGQTRHTSVSNHNDYAFSHPKPVSIFNIFRNDGVKKEHRSNNYHGVDEAGDVINIDSLNVYPHGHGHGHVRGHGQAVWKQPPMKKHPHGLYGGPRRPIKYKHRRPLKWRISKIRTRKHASNRNRRIMRIHKNISKLDNKFTKF